MPKNQTKPNHTKFSGPLWPRVAASDSVLFMGKIEQTVCKQMTDVAMWLLNKNTWNYLTVCKEELKVFKKFISKICLHIIHIQ